MEIRKYVKTDRIPVIQTQEMGLNKFVGSIRRTELLIW